MQIKDVEFSQYRYCGEQSRHFVTVCMTLPDRVITMFCRADLPENETTGRCKDAFLRDAARQLKRMPEFRADDVAQDLRMTPANLPRAQLA